MYVRGTAQSDNIPTVILTGDRHNQCNHSQEEYPPGQTFYEFDCYVNYTVTFVTVVSESLEPMFITEIKVYGIGGGGGSGDVTMDENKECQVLDQGQIEAAIRYGVQSALPKSKAFYMPRKILSDCT